MGTFSMLPQDLQCDLRQVTSHLERVLEVFGEGSCLAKDELLGTGPGQGWCPLVSGQGNRKPCPQPDHHHLSQETGAREICDGKHLF